MNARFEEYSNVEPMRDLPANVEAEQNVLGALMMANATLAKIADWLKPEDFSRHDHAEIYRAIQALAGKGKPFDSVMLCEWFESNGEIAKYDHGSYLISLQSQTGSAANLVAYAEIVSDKAKLREAIEIGARLATAAYAQQDTNQIIADASYGLAQLRGDARSGGLVPAASGLSDWYDDLQHRYDHGNKVTGIPYPWADVNSVTHGLQPGELTIIAARPSMGKSVMGLNLAMFSALREVNTAFFSLEMTTRQVNRRCISSLSEVDHEWLLAPDKEREENWAKVMTALKALKAAPLLVDDSAGLSTDQVVARARRAHMQKPIQLLVMDHLHDMAFPGKRDMRHEVGDAVAAWKGLAKEFNCPAVMLAQLNRGVESRADKRPQMSDLRESGEIEQKADVIWFLYREDYYNRNTPGYQPQHDVELILGKGRDLRVGAPILLRDDFARMALRDWEGPRPTRGTTDNKGGGKRGLAEI